jgi:hypothetical protein
MKAEKITMIRKLSTRKALVSFSILVVFLFPLAATTIAMLKAKNQHSMMLRNQISKEAAKTNTASLFGLPGSKNARASEATLLSLTGMSFLSLALILRSRLTNSTTSSGNANSSPAIEQT